MLLKSELPSWGVKQVPMISRSPLIAKLCDTITVWLRILPNMPWSRPNEKTDAEDFL